MNLALRAYVGNLVAESLSTYRFLQKRIVKVSLFLLILWFVGYFYVGEFMENQMDLGVLGVSFDHGYLLIALVLGILSYLADAVIWRLMLNAQPGLDRLTFQEVFAIVFGSGLIRYVPGRIWTFAAQFLWLRKYGISKSLIIYVNLIFVIQILLFTCYATLAYLAMYTREFPSVLVFMSLGVIVLLNILFVLYNGPLINRTFSSIARLTKRVLLPIDLPPRLLLVIQLFFVLSWLIFGLAVFFLAWGCGLQLNISDVVPIIASISSAGLASSLVFIAPAGLGIREGVMLLMLKPVVAIQTALFLPLATRLLLLLMDAAFGLVALVVGIRQKVYRTNKVLLDDVAEL